MRPLDEVLMCLLSHMAEVHILCMTAGVGLEEVASLVQGDASVMA